MTERCCSWRHMNSDFHLKAESHQDRYMVYLTIGDDVSIVETNPISIYVLLTKQNAAGEKYFTMVVGGTTVNNIPEKAAKGLAQALDCELTVNCDKCAKEDALKLDISGEYDYVCPNCAHQ